MPYLDVLIDEGLTIDYFYTLLLAFTLKKLNNNFLKIIYLYKGY